MADSDLDLPDWDLPGHEPEPDIAGLFANGWKVSMTGDRYDVVSPEGRHGAGSTLRDAIANIGAHVYPSPPAASKTANSPETATYTGRLMIRENGDEIMLDQSLIPPVP